MRPLFFIYIFLSAQIAICQVSFIINELPETYDYTQSIYISGDFEGWTGGKKQFKFNQKEKQYQITLTEIPCDIQFKFTMGLWESVERNSKNR